MNIKMSRYHFKEKIPNSILGYWPVSDRVIMVKIRGQPLNVNIIQVYAPTQDHADEEVEALYEKIENVIQRIKSGEVTCIRSDFNAKVGTKLAIAAGKYGLGDTNERGERLVEFSQQHDLVIIIFHSPQKPIPPRTSIKIGKKHITRVKYLKFLGHLLDDTLSWKYHLSGLSKKLARTCGIPYRIRPFLPTETLVCLYNSLFMSFLQYGITVWGQACASYIDPIIKLQKKAVRIHSHQSLLCHCYVFIKMPRSKTTDRTTICQSSTQNN